MECRENDDFVQSIIQTVHHEPSAIRCRSERAFMREMEGGCQVPIGVHTLLLPSQDSPHPTGIRLEAIVLNLDGSRSVHGHLESETFSVAASEALGRDLAQLLRSQGAMEILAEIYQPHAASD